MSQNQTGGFNDCLAGKGNGSGQTSPVEIDREAAATMSVQVLGIRIVVLYFVFYLKSKIMHNTLSAGTNSPACEWVSPSLCVPLHRITIGANCFHHGIVLTSVPAYIGWVRLIEVFLPLTTPVVIYIYRTSRYVKPGAFSGWAAPDHHIYTVSSTVYIC